MFATSPTNSGYCIGHDPEVTSEVRQEWRDGKGMPRLSGRRKLRTAEDIIEWIEGIVFQFEEKAPVLTADVISVYADLARVLIQAIKEKNGKKADKRVVPPSWRESG